MKEVTLDSKYSHLDPSNEHGYNFFGTKCIPWLNEKLHRKQYMSYMNFEYDPCRVTIEFNEEVDDSIITEFMLRFC